MNQELKLIRPYKNYCDGEKPTSHAKMIHRNILKIRKIIEEQKKQEQDIKKKVEFPQTIEFGNIVKCIYSDHEDGIQVKNFIQNKNMGAYLSFTDKHMHLWRIMRKEKEGLYAKNQFNVRLLEHTNSRNISCMAYSNQLYLYFLVSTDFKLHIFNEYLFYVGCFNMPSRLIHYICIIEDKRQLITGGVDGCFQYQIMLSNSYDPFQQLFLDPESEFLDIKLKNMGVLQNSSSWIKGLKICNDHQMISSWSHDSLNFNYFNGNLIYQYNNLTQNDDLITDVIYNNELRCYVTSTEKGNLFAWKFWKQKQLLHKFESHKSKITSLKHVNDHQNIFISGSTDNTIRIFSLELYQQLYRFNFSSGIRKFIFFENDNIGCLFNTNRIKIFKLQRIANSFLTSKNEILKVQKCFLELQNLKQNHMNFIMCLQNNDSISIFNIEKKILKIDEKKKQFSKTQSKFIANIFPPSKANSIIFMQYLIRNKQILILLSSGDLQLFNFIIEDLQVPELQSTTNYRDLVDSSMIKNSCAITSVYVCQNQPLKLDQIASQYYENKIQSTKQTQLCDTDSHQNQQDRFIALGLQKGIVVFLEINDIKKIYSRFQVHQESVQRICEITKQKIYVSICSQMNICLWDFTGDVFNIINCYKMHREISQMISMESCLLLGFKTGETHLFNYSEIFKQLVYIEDDDCILQHNQSVTSMDTLISRKLYVTGCLQGFIKIWNAKKQLIREIKFSEPINSLIFSNNEGDIMVAHGNSISLIKQTDYFLREDEKIYQQTESSIDNYFLEKSQHVSDDLFHELIYKYQGIQKNNTKMYENKLLNEFNILKQKKLAELDTILMQKSPVQQKSLSNSSEESSSCDNQSVFIQNQDILIQKLEQKSPCQIRNAQLSTQKNSNNQINQINTQMNTSFNDSEFKYLEAKKQVENNTFQKLNKQNEEKIDYLINESEIILEQMNEKIDNKQEEEQKENDSIVIDDFIQIQAHTTAIPRLSFFNSQKRPSSINLIKNKIFSKQIIKSGSQKQIFQVAPSINKRREKTMQIINQNLIQFNQTSINGMSFEDSFEGINLNVNRSQNKIPIYSQKSGFVNDHNLKNQKFNQQRIKSSIGIFKNKSNIGLMSRNRLNIEQNSRNFLNTTLKKTETERSDIYFNILNKKNDTIKKEGNHIQDIILQKIEQSSQSNVTNNLPIQDEKMMIYKQDNLSMKYTTLKKSVVLGEKRNRLDQIDSQRQQFDSSVDQEKRSSNINLNSIIEQNHLRDLQSINQTKSYQDSLMNYIENMSNDKNQKLIVHNFKKYKKAGTIPQYSKIVNSNSNEENKFMIISEQESKQPIKQFEKQKMILPLSKLKQGENQIVIQDNQNKEQQAAETKNQSITIRSNKAQVENKIKSIRSKISLRKNESQNTSNINQDILKKSQSQTNFYNQIIRNNSQQLLNPVQNDAYKNRKQVQSGNKSQNKESLNRTTSRINTTKRQPPNSFLKTNNQSNSDLSPHKSILQINLNDKINILQNVQLKAMSFEKQNLQKLSRNASKIRTFQINSKNIKTNNHGNQNMNQYFEFLSNYKSTLDKLSGTQDASEEQINIERIKRSESQLCATNHSRSTGKITVQHMMMQSQTNFNHRPQIYNTSHLFKKKNTQL